MNNQPPPTENEQSKEVAAEVLKDIEARVKLGEARYGTRLKTFNGRDALQDAYEEILDCAFYIKQCLMELAVLKHFAGLKESNDDTER